MNDTISIPMPERIRTAVDAIRNSWDEDERQRRRRIGAVRQLDLLRMLFPEDVSSESA